MLGPSSVALLSSRGANSSPGSLIFLPGSPPSPGIVVHAGHGSLHVSRPVSSSSSDVVRQSLPLVSSVSPLSSSTGGGELTALSSVRVVASSSSSSSSSPSLLPSVELARDSFLSGGTTGRVTVWTSSSDDKENATSWSKAAELSPPSSIPSAPVTCISCLRIERHDSAHPLLTIVAFSLASYSGVFVFVSSAPTTSSSSSSDADADNTFKYHGCVLGSLLVECIALDVNLPSSTVLLCCGAAQPRNNKVNVLSSRLPVSSSSSSSPLLPPFTNNGSLIGHQDWVRCLAFSPPYASLGNGTLLASGSHDHKIRLWLFNARGVTPLQQPNSSSSTTSSSSAAHPLLASSSLAALALDDAADSSSSEDEKEVDVDALLSDASRLVLYDCNGVDIHVSLEALLIGHEESVSSVCWHPSPSSPCLLSSSMDRTLLLWAPDGALDGGGGGVWSPVARVGAAGGIIGGSLGSSLLGFVGAVWGEGGREIVGCGYGGSIHFWSSSSSAAATTSTSDDSSGKQLLLQQQQQQQQQEHANQRWETLCGVTGHFGPAVDCCWEPVTGAYLLSSSADQTTRMWAPVDLLLSDRREVWCEVGRPQVHGYDLTSVVCIGVGRRNGGEPLHRFVSGADEKPLRVFDAPRATTKLLQQLLGLQQEPKDEDGGGAPIPERAYMPALGLSNKGGDGSVGEEAGIEIDDGEGAERRCGGGGGAGVRLPLERDLGCATLWPEAKKLYGHSAEVLSLASTAQSRKRDPNRKVVVASACVARDVDKASIHLWDVEGGVCCGMLEGGHKSSVAALAFNVDGRLLASSGKDRRLCVWRAAGDSGKEANSFALFAAEDDAHKRIVWCLNWSNVDDNILVSGGRDGLLKVWRINTLSSSESTSPRMECLNVISYKDAVTAAAFAPSSNLVAVGFESGKIDIVDSTKKAIEGDANPSQLEIRGAHVATVKKLCWRPKQESPDEPGGDRSEYLASCGMDGAVKVFKVTF